MRDGADVAGPVSPVPTRQAAAGLAAVGRRQVAPGPESRQVPIGDLVRPRPVQGFGHVHEMSSTRRSVTPKLMPSTFERLVRG